nr:hypothetical protein [Tanacetum cinerariifolium]
MTSFGYRLNPRYAIKECLSCGALYTGNFCCSKGSVEDKALVPKPPKNCVRCAKCGHPVNGPNCQGCALLREKLKEGLVSCLKYFHDTSESSDDNTNVVNAPREPFVVKQDHGVKSSQNPPPIDECCCECGNALDGIFCQQCIRCTLLRKKLEEDLVSYLKYFHDTFESSDDSTNVVNASREPFVVKQDHGVKSSQNPPPIDECCCECGNALDGIFCQQCICKSCGKGAHIGYNCPPKVPIISNPEPCNKTMNDELPQTFLGFDPTCYSKKENSAPCISKPNFVDESSNIFNPPPQPPIYSCEFCGSNAQYGHYCIPQAQFNNPEQGYNQDLNFPQNIHNFQQQYLCCDQCGGPYETFQCQQVIFYEPCCENYGGPHETFQCQPTNEEYYHEQNFCYNSNSFGSDHCQPSKYTVNHPIFDAHNDFLNSQNELFTSQNTIMEQMTQLTSMCEMVCQNF